MVMIPAETILMQEREAADRAIAAGKQREEIERLESETDQLRAILQAREAEITRLRSALEEIAGLDDSRSDECCSVANRALRR